MFEEIPSSQSWNIVLMVNLTDKLKEIMPPAKSLKRLEHIFGAQRAKALLSLSLSLLASRLHLGNRSRVS